MGGRAFTAGVTSDMAIAVGRSMLQRFDVEWAAAGFTDDKLDELVEVMLLTQSLIVDPGRPARTGAKLRAFLEDWGAPSLRAHVGLRS
jgi:hypothetical protein